MIGPRLLDSQTVRESQSQLPPVTWNATDCAEGEIQDLIRILHNPVRDNPVTEPTVDGDKFERLDGCNYANRTEWWFGFEVQGSVVAYGKSDRVAPVDKMALSRAPLTLG